MNNRCIKFRIWVKSEKKMHNWHYNEHIIKDAIPYDSGDDWTDDCELMQFTGLFSRDGEEIYEGDIVKFDYSDNKGVGKVVYWQNGFYIESKHGALFQDTLPTLKNCKIIGNIFQNPKLLK